MFTGIEVPPGMRLRFASLLDLESVKQVDDEAFAQHQGISMEELEALLGHGAVILLETEDGRLIGESQVLLRSISALKHTLQPDQTDEAFYYGTGVVKASQGFGYGKILATAQDSFASAQGKIKASLTVRPENYASIKLRMDKGFLITGYLPRFYESADGAGDRLFMFKNFCPAPFPAFSNISSVAVVFGNVPDHRADQSIAELIGQGYQGFKIDKKEGKIYFGK